MPWVEVFAVFVASHLVGDYLLQTEWQATHKWGGLGPDSVSRRALISHLVSYSLAFIPALVWLADDLGAGVLGAFALIAGPHLVQDDGRLISAYVRTVKRADPGPGPLMTAVDQSFHVLALFLVALLAGN
jgi:hypothetical protein